MPSQTPSEVFAERTKTVREDRRWSQRQLAERLTEMDAPIHQTAVAKIESGARKVSLDEALRVAAALDVSPIALFLPEDEDARIALGARFQPRCEYVRRWVAGLAPLPLFTAAEAPGSLSDEELVEAGLKTHDAKHLSQKEAAERGRFWEKWLPLGRWNAYRRPGVQHLVQLTDSYAAAVADEDRVAMKRCLNQLAAELERQQAQMDEED